MHRNFSLRNEKLLIFALRVSLGLIFFWFGALKVIGYNPVYEIVYSTFPLFATGIGNVVLGLIEAAIGIGLLWNAFRPLVHGALLLHLVGTFSTFFMAPSLMFDPYFPILTLSGEFVFKNITLAIAGLVVASRNR